MNFDLSQDQKMLVDTAASFAKKSSPVARARKLRSDPLGFEPKMWKQMAELGWLGLCVPESEGGFGARFVDLALILEQLGGTLVPEPLIATCVLGGTALARAGSDEQRARWLAPLAAGELHASLAWAERDSRYEPAACAARAEPVKGGFKLAGDKVWVQGGHAADLFLVTARTGGGARERSGVSLFAVDAKAPGVEVQPVDTIDGRRAAMVRLRGVEVGADRLLGEKGEAVSLVEDVLDVAAAAGCAESVGIAQAVLAMTVEYLKTREQFGVKIGTFQVLQHRAVEMFVETELLRSHSIEASLRIDEGEEEERRRAVSAAVVQLATGGRFVVRQGIQLHGGIGCTDEHDIGLYFKRLQILGALFGDEDHHLARFAALTQPPGVPL
ncbi:MAG TPA: acyl-CoA dehydrogenase family protein [Kofleriaceae bacterium]|nr:acyl-CoA dehydrogenase family protein [Kofleriaceae bacterium]